MIKDEIGKCKTRLEMRGAADDILAEMGCFVKAVLESVLKSVPEEHRNEVANCMSLMMIETVTDARKNAERS